MACKGVDLQLPKQITNKAKAVGVVTSPARGFSNERIHSLGLLSTFREWPCLGHGQAIDLFFQRHCQVQARIALAMKRIQPSRELCRWGLNGRVTDCKAQLLGEGRMDSR